MALAELGPLVLVTGKGGVGKTTVAAGLAALAARRDGGATLVELGDGCGGARTRVDDLPGVEHVVVRTDEAVRIAARGLFGSALLARLVVRTRAIERLIAGTPALQAFALLEAIRAVADERPGRRVVVDLPATGHGVAWLRIPAQLSSLLREGAGFHLSDRVRRMLRPERSSTVVVACPEPLVVEETIGLGRALQRDLGLPPSLLVVNRMPRALPEGTLDAVRGWGESRSSSGLVDAVERLLRRYEAARWTALDLARLLETGLMTLVQFPDGPTAAGVADHMERA